MLSKKISIFSFLFLLLTSFLPIIRGFVQELILYENLSDDEAGNRFIFTSNVPDTSIYSFGTVRRVCARGRWWTFDGPHFEDGASMFGDLGSSTYSCSNGSFPFKSFRHYAASDTDTSAISLYAQVWHEGTETLVTQSAYGGITGSIGSFTTSGRSSWTLFEGKNFDGNAICCTAGSPNYNFSYALDIAALNLTGVGSVYRNCDFKNIPMIDCSIPVR